MSVNFVPGEDPENVVSIWTRNISSTKKLINCEVLILTSHLQNQQS